MFNFILIKLCAEHKLFINQTHLNFDFEKAVILATLFDINLTIKGYFNICAKVVLEKFKILGLLKIMTNLANFVKLQLFIFSL